MNNLTKQAKAVFEQKTGLKAIKFASLVGSMKNSFRACVKLEQVQSLVDNWYSLPKEQHKIGDCPIEFLNGNYNGLQSVFIRRKDLLS